MSSESPAVKVAKNLRALFEGAYRAGVIDRSPDALESEYLDSLTQQKWDGFQMAFAVLGIVHDDAAEAEIVRAEHVATPAFTVAVGKMVESHRTTHVVSLVNTKLAAKGGGFSEDGVITPYFSEDIEKATHTAKEWAVFLGVPDQVECNCIMCE